MGPQASARPGPDQPSQGPGTSGSRRALANAEVRWTGRRQGDRRPSRRGSPGAWHDLVDRPVSWLRQVHGARVVVVDQPGDRRDEEADALVSAHPGAALAILTADCAPVALASPEGVVGAAHAGWSGLLEGVLERTVEAMRALGATRVEAALGPCIGVECYEFGTTHLDRAVGRLGPTVRGTTSAGAPALDLSAAVRVALGRVGADLVHDEGVCTACAADSDFLYFSHRARREQERQAMLVWKA